jgi:hypothetical protein
MSCANGHRTQQASTDSRSGRFRHSYGGLLAAGARRFRSGRTGGADSGEEDFGRIVVRIRGDELTAEGLPKQAPVEPVEEMGGTTGLDGEPVDAGESGLNAPNGRKRSQCAERSRAAPALVRSTLSAGYPALVTIWCHCST